MRLRAGGHIKPHSDHKLSMEFGEARLHLPVCGNQAVEFLVNRQPVPMNEGELWYINAHLKHEVINKGPEDRINIVVDCEVNDSLKARILAGAQRRTEQVKSNLHPLEGQRHSS